MVISSLGMCYILHYYDHAVLIEYGRKEETVGKHAV